MTRKKIAAVLGSALLLALISLPLAACDGDGNGNGGEETPASTGLARTTCKPAEPVVLSAPTDLPPDLAEYQSPEMGYRVRFPNDWEARPNTIAMDNMTGDAFFSATSEGQVKPNMSVICEIVPVGTTSQEYSDAKRDVILRVMGKLPEVERTLTVDGREAVLVTYALEQKTTPDPIEIEKIEVYFADDLGGWTVSLTVPTGTLETYRAIFDAFVESFRGG